MSSNDIGLPLKFCSSCGAGSQPEALYCGKCGKGFGSIPLASGPNVGSERQNITVVVKNESKTPIFSIFGICCGVLGIFTLGFIFVPLGFLFTLLGLLRGELLSALISGVINFVGLLTSPVLVAGLGLGLLFGSASLPKHVSDSPRSQASQATPSPNSSAGTESTSQPVHSSGASSDSSEDATASVGTNAIPAITPDPSIGSMESKVKTLVLAVLTGDKTNVQSIIDDIKLQPKGEHGDRKTARRLNGDALLALQSDNYDAAMKLLMQARDADIGDVEIRENLAYTQMKSGLLDQAEVTLMTVFSDSPDRASAWGTLGQVYVLRDKEEQAIACLVTAHKYSRNQKKTIEVYQRLVDSDPDVRVQSAARKSLALLQDEPQIPAN